MKTVIQSNRSVFVAGAMATLAVAAMGFAGGAQARDNVYWSVGVGTPGAVVNVGNVGSVYPSQPVYVQPAPVYMQPAPVYMQPRPVYVSPAPVYVAPQPMYYGRPHGHGHGHRRDGYYQQQMPQAAYGPAYAPVYYDRDGRNGNWNGNRR